MNKRTSLKKKTLLVVEDDKGSRLLIKHFLEKLDLDVIDAETGEEALELVKNEPVEGMLLDIALGAGINGLDLGEKLKADQRFKDVPMVAVTAFDKDSLKKLEEIGFTGYLHKPYSADELKALLHEQTIHNQRRKLLL
ncbi:MAG: response regulator [Candidatus Marinimicrobia bacterium]|nr:response regulator [Candidatus Neomarinimicrobiota bacterium]